MAPKRGRKKKDEETPVPSNSVEVDDRDALIVKLSERVSALENELLSTRDGLQEKQEELEVQTEELEAHLEKLNVANEELEKEIQVRQLSEEALRKSRFILAKSQEMAHVGNWAWHVPTGSMNWSDESFRIFGHLPGEFKPDWEWLVSRVYIVDRGLLSDMATAVTRDGKKRDADVRVVLPSGAVRHVNLLADKVVRDKAGAVSRVYGIFQDVTERKRLEEALKEREKQLKSRLNAILSPGNASEKTISEIVDIPSLQEMADSFHTMTGVPNAIIDLSGMVLVGSGWQDICTKFHRCHPETCKNCIESDVHLSSSVEEGKYAVYKCKNGMWDAVTPIVVNGKHIANLFTGQFFFEDEVPDYDHFLRQAETYGFNKDEYMAALGKVPRHSREKVRKVMDFYTRFAAMVSQLSYTNVQLAGLLIKQKESEQSLQEKMEEIEVQSEEIEVQNEELRTNLDELTELTRSLRESEERERARSEDLKEAKSQAELYLDIMGHDLSNMHQIALSQLELAQEIMEDEGKLVGEDIEMIATPIETLQRSARLIENVGKLQKLRAGEYRVESIDAGRMLAEVVEEHAARGTGATINCTLARGCLVKANPLLKEAFTNLVGNAIKHSQGTPTINIAMSRVAENGSSFCLIAVEDNGPGIPDEKKGEIFHRFKRGQTQAKGTGLGLYIARTLVENFKGRILVEDRVPGDYTKGSKFIVYLPVAED